MTADAPSRRDGEPIGLGIAGLGMAGALMVRAAAQHRGFRLAAAADPHAAPREAFARDFGARVLSDLAQRMSAGSAYQRALASIIAEGGAHGHPYVWGAMRLT